MEEKDGISAPLLVGSGPRGELKRLQVRRGSMLNMKIMFSIQRDQCRDQ